MPTFFRVKPVEGFMIQDPLSIGTGSARMIGHTKHYDGCTFPYGVNPSAPDKGGVPRPVYDLVEGDDVVAETTDGFLRNAIRAGALEYIETIVAPDIATARDPKGSNRRVSIDPSLVRGE